MQDRREFFRIEDMAFVDTAPWRSDQTSIPEYFPSYKFFIFKGELEKLEADAKDIYAKVDDERLKQLVDIQNQKLDLIANFLLIKDISEAELAPTKVVISEGGVGFFSPKHYDDDSEIAMILLFTPSYLPIFARAKVIQCRQTEGGFYIHANFVGLVEETRQKLARHLLRQQTVARQQEVESVTDQ